MLGNDLGKGTPGMVISSTLLFKLFSRTNPAGEHSFVVDIALNPTHQMLNVRRRGHFGRSLVVFRILPEILESKGALNHTFVHVGNPAYSSVAFISGHDCGEQNSVIDP